MFGKRGELGRGTNKKKTKAYINAYEKATKESSNAFMSTSGHDNRSHEEIRDANNKLIKDYLIKKYLEQKKKSNTIYLLQ